MTAVVIQEGLTPGANTTQVQVQLATDSQNVLTVFVDGTTVDFSDPLSQSKEFYSKFPLLQKVNVSGTSIPH